MVSKQIKDERTHDTPPDTDPSATNIQTPSRWRRFAQIVFVYAAILFALCVTVQIFIAGLAIFDNSLHWRRHTTFVHLFDLIPLLMLILSFVGQLPKQLRWQTAGLIALLYVQYFTANIVGQLPLVAAAHPVVAMVIFWLSIKVVQASWWWTHKPKLNG